MYKEIWEAAVREELVYAREHHNSNDHYTVHVAVKSMVAEKGHSICQSQHFQSCHFQSTNLNVSNLDMICKVIETARYKSAKLAIH